MAEQNKINETVGDTITSSDVKTSACFVLSSRRITKAAHESKSGKPVDVMMVQILSSQQSTRPDASGELPNIAVVSDVFVNPDLYAGQMVVPGFVHAGEMEYSYGAKGLQVRRLFVGGKLSAKELLEKERRALNKGG